MGESYLRYTWAVTSAPSGAPSVSFSANGTNSAKVSTATFGASGQYTITVSVTNYASGLSGTASVTVTVNQTASGITVEVPTDAVHVTHTHQFHATETDQFQQAMSTQPASFAWSIDQTGGGSMTSGGLYTAPLVAETYTVRASADGLSGTAPITVINSAPTIAVPATADPNPVTAQ